MSSSKETAPLPLCLSGREGAQLLWVPISKEVAQSLTNLPVCFHKLILVLKIPPTFGFSRVEFHLSPLLCVSMCACSVAQSCPTLCDPMDCSLPGASIHGISKARILEWVVISSSRGFPNLPWVEPISPASPMQVDCLLACHLGNPILYCSGLK